mmetsp:Transcript_53147/g.154681  ORF Transcript_53147/g.154681 Transcript_53147/m.154681 type:complete len:226 (+) Transcript_53147:356-1033(+)
MEHLGHALIHEEILSPTAVSRAELVEVRLALLPAVSQSLNCRTREDLNGTTQAEPAVVEVQTVLMSVKLLFVPMQHRPEAAREKHRVRVYFDRPVVKPETPLVEDLPPELAEGTAIHVCLELTARAAVQAHRKNADFDAKVAAKGLIAVDCEAITCKDASVLLVVHAEQGRLPARGQCERNTVEHAGLPWVQRRCRGGRRCCGGSRAACGSGRPAGSGAWSTDES